MHKFYIPQAMKITEQVNDLITSTPTRRVRELLYDNASMFTDGLCTLLIAEANDLKDDNKLDIDHCSDLAYVFMESYMSDQIKNMALATSARAWSHPYTQDLHDQALAALNEWLVIMMQPYITALQDILTSQHEIIYPVYKHYKIKRNIGQTPLSVHCVNTAGSVYAFSET